MGAIVKNVKKKYSWATNKESAEISYCTDLYEFLLLEVTCVKKFLIQKKQIAIFRRCLQNNFPVHRIFML